MGGAILSVGAAIGIEEAAREELRVPGGAGAAKIGPRPFTYLLCKADRIALAQAAQPKTLSLVLPVTIGLKDAVNVDKDYTDCWHEMPAHPPRPNGAAVTGTPNGNGAAATSTPKGNGWLYRVVLEKPPFGAQNAQGFFTKKDVQHSFPYTPCQDARLEIVW